KILSKGSSCMDFILSLPHWGQCNPGSTPKCRGQSAWLCPGSTVALRRSEPVLPCFGALPTALRCFAAQSAVEGSLSCVAVSFGPCGERPHPAGATPKDFPPQ